MLIFIICACLVFIADLLTKVLTDGQQVGVLRGVVSFASVHNYGAAFSMQIPLWVLILCSLFVIGVGLYYYVKRFGRSGGRRFVFLNLGAGFVLGGAVGNLVDRIFLGYVRDFIRLEFIDFPVFNLADVFLNIGMVMVVIHFLFVEKQAEKRA